MIDNGFKHKKGIMSIRKHVIKVPKDLLEKCTTTYEAMMIVSISEFIDSQNGCRETVETLANNAFMSERQGQRVIKSLYERGLINFKKHSGKTYNITFK